jgi:hypothetical protein
LADRNTFFLEAMAVIAVVGVLAFLIGLVVRAPAGAGRAQPAEPPQWYQFALATLLLAAAAAFAIWVIANGKVWAWGEAIGDWRANDRAIAFAIVMVALGAVGLVAAFAYAVTQSAPRGLPKPQPATAGEAAAVPTASPARVLGLLGLALAILLLCWIALPAAQQHALFAQLVYPASLGVALVLLFDKATRSWGNKPAAATVREWLLCDTLVFLLVLAFLGLRALPKPESYAGGFWDMLAIVLFFAAFWAIDRSAARSRFVLGYGYLIILPLLALIRDAIQGTPAPASWWATIWPFLILAVVFFVLEIITLVSTSDERGAVPAVKDALFVLLYAILLIIAR